MHFKEYYTNEWVFEWAAFIIYNDKGHLFNTYLLDIAQKYSTYFPHTTLPFTNMEKI